MQIFGLVLLCLLVLIAVAVWRQQRLKRACRAAFLRVYAEWTPVPHFEMSSSYGYPAFTVLFKTKPEVQAAEQAGLNAAFLREIDELCKGRGSKTRPFEAKVAVFFAHEGYMEELLNRTKISP